MTITLGAPNAPAVDVNSIVIKALADRDAADAAVVTSLATKVTPFAMTNMKTQEGGQEVIAFIVEWGML